MDLFLLNKRFLFKRLLLFDSLQGHFVINKNLLLNHLLRNIVLNKRFLIKRLLLILLRQQLLFQLLSLFKFLFHDFIRILNPGTWLLSLKNSLLGHEVFFL